MLHPRPLTNRRRRVVGGALACLAVVALAACGDDSADGGGGDSGPLADLPAVADSEYQDMTGKDAVTVDVRDNSYMPQYITVSPGTEITFANEGRNPHNVLPVEAGGFEDVAVDEMQPGDSAVRTFDDSGDFPYYCSLHGTPSRGMTGRIRVAES